jgi:hypothetical protein
MEPEKPKPAEKPKKARIPRAVAGAERVKRMKAKAAALKARS